MVSIDYLAYSSKRLFHKPVLEIVHFGYYNCKLIPTHVYNKLMINKKGDISISDYEFATNIMGLSLSDYSSIHESIYQYTLSRDKSRFFFNPDNSQLKRDYLSNYAEQAEETIECANKYLKHEFNFLGKQIKFDGQVNYHYGFEQNPTYNAYFSNINYFIPNWDIKITWELNRQQHLLILGKAYFITNDEKYSKEVCDQIEQWIEQNPYLQGVNWVEGIEAAIRMYSWIFAYHFISNSKSLTPEVNSKILKYIYLHGKFIRTFLSDKWIINGNHLLAELSGLLLIGITFPGFKESKEWISFALDKLESELSTQVFNDGVIWEHSTGYQKFVTEMVLYPVILLTKNGYKAPESILLKLEKMLHFLDSITMSNGLIPLIGDEDQGFMLRLSFSEYDDIRDILSCGAVLFENVYRTINSELSFWLFDGLIFSQRKVSIKKQNFELFKDSGYCLFKSSDDYLLLATNAQNKKYLHAAHRHLDILSFVYEYNGEYFIVDNGTYIYNGDKQNRDLFRSIWMHNTLTIDHKNPCELGPFELQLRPYSQIISSGKIDSCFFILACSNAYKSLFHIRSIIQIKDGYLITDFVKSDHSHNYETYINLHSQLQINMTNDYTVELFKNSVKLYIHSLKHVDIVESKYSHKYGVYTDSKALRVKIKANTYENVIKLSKTNSKITENDLELINRVLHKK